MLKFKTKVLIALGTAVGALGMAGSAYAAGTFTVTPNTGLVDQQLVQVSYSGMKPNSLIIARMCRGTRATTPGFNVNTDCSQYSEDTTSTSNAAGSGTIPGFTNGGYLVYKGQALDGGGLGLPWACVGPNDTVPAGIQKVTNCQLRLTDGDVTQVTNESFQTLTFADAAGVNVPESKYAVLLPLGGLAVLAGAFFVLRNRKSLAA